MEKTYSVLMSVYYKEKPEYLKQSMESIYEQTVPTNDFVLVCDGPLNAELDAVIDEMQQQFGDVLHVCRLEKNGGLGNALNIGIKHCKNELVARMDSDDICKLDRCEKELKIFQDYPELSIVGTLINEFVEKKEDICGTRLVPCNYNEIIKFAKKRNPFNHVSVMYKRIDVEKAGGYKSFFLLEDYFLWIRMLNYGCKGYNLQEPLVFVRVGKEMYKRRGGWKYVASQRKLFKYMAKIGFITYNQYVIQSIVRLIGAIIPNGMRAIVYKKILRK